MVPATAAPSHDAAVWPVPRLRWLPARTVWAALVCIPVRDAAGPRSWPRHGEQWHKYCWGESGNVWRICQWARKIRMGKGPPGAPRKGWTSAEGLWALGARCACVMLPQCAPPANTFPTTAAATSQPVRLPKIACRRVGSSHTRALAASVAGTSLVVALASISLCNFSCSQCLQGAGTGAKTVVLVPVWPLGMHCDRSTPASGSSQAPTGGFFFPCEAHIDSCRRQK